MQQHTRAEANDLTYANLPDNAKGAINPAKLREVLLALIASYLNLLDDGNPSPGPGGGPPPAPATFGNLAGNASDNTSLVSYVASLGHTLTEFTAPLLTAAGRWYLTPTGIWEARSSFNASALPAANAYWRLVAGFGDALQATAAGRALLAAPTALAQRQLLDIFSTTAGQYGTGQPAFTNAYRADGALIYLLQQAAYLRTQLAALTTPVPGGPVITGFLPTGAPVAASVTLTGTGFAKASAVFFNGTPASFQVVNPTTLIATVPAGATTGPLAVVAGSVTGTSAARFTVSAATTAPGATIIARPLTLAAARALQMASAVEANVLYTIEDTGWNGSSNDNLVAIHGLGGSEFAPVGYGLVAGKPAFVTVDVTAGTYAEVVAASAAPAISALFLSDTTGILSPEGQARLDASALYWLVPATTQTPPVVVVPPAPTQRMLVQLADKGVKNDGVITNKKFSGGSDNASALMAVRATNATTPFRQQQPVELVAPAGGVVGYTSGQLTKWLYGYYDVKLNVNGATIISIYVPDNPNSPDNFFTAFAYRREMLQNNGQDYRGTKQYFNCARIATVAAGSDTITAINPADIADETLYGVGKRICVYSKEVVLGEEAYPPSTKHNETPRIIISRTATQLKLDKQLEYEHRADYPENPQTSGGGGGRARIVPLDGPGNEYPERFEVAGTGTLQSSDAASPGAFGWIANVLVVGPVTITNGATVTETLTSAEFNGTKILGEFEGDKMVGPVTFNSVQVGFCSNWGGVRSFKMVGGKSTQSLQVAPPDVFLDGVECWASAYTTDSGTKTKADDGAVSSYTGFHNTKLFRYRNLKLGADNNATSYLSPLELRTATVTAVNGNRAGFRWTGAKNDEAVLVWRGAQPGTRFYTLDGAKIGRQVGETQFVPDVPDCTSGTMWANIPDFMPAVGDVYEFSNVLSIIDDGGHTILTPNHPARLYSEEALIWKGNQSMAGAPGAVTITKADLRFKDGGTGAYVVLRGKPRKITLNLPTAVPGARLLIVGENKARTSQSDSELVRFGLDTAGTRYAGTAGASSGLTATNETSTSANQWRPQAFGAWAYTLVVYFDGTDLAHIPDDFSLTLETDFS